MVAQIGWRGFGLKNVMAAFLFSRDPRKKYTRDVTMLFVRFMSVFALLVLTGCTTVVPLKTVNEDLAPERSSGFRHIALTRGEQSMVVAAHPLASKAGRKVLDQGGSAMDAAIAVQAMLTLVEPQSSGIGGGAFMLYYDAGADRLYAYDGRETAPAQATEALFLDAEGNPMPFFDAVVGGRSVGAPGVLRMLDLAHREHGRQLWKTLFSDAIERAQNGFAVTPRLHKLLSLDAYLANDADARALYFDAVGEPVRPGTILKNPALAETLSVIASQGADAFYKGPIARDIVGAVGSHSNPGLLSLNDLANYEAVARQPVSVNYRGYRVCGMPPPTSGGVTTLQILKLLEPFGLGVDPYAPRYLHLLAEAERLAYADRGRYLADADHVHVPVEGLLSDAYTKQRAGLIQQNEVMADVLPGIPPGVKQSRVDGQSIEQPNTSHFSIVDAEGNIVSMTSSIESAFGSRLMVRGFLLNNQLTDFSFRHIDAEGVAIANGVAPRKRPRSSMSPIIVFDKEDRPVLVVGSPGGSRIIGYVAQTILHVLDFGLNVQEAVTLPHVVNRGGKTELEDHPEHMAMLNRVETELVAMGHDVIRNEQNSGLHAIAITPGGLEGGVDPRREGNALGD